MGFSMRGWRGRIGLLYPDDGVNDDEFWLYLPEGVTLIMTRYTTPQRDNPIAPEMVDGYADLKVLETAAHVLKITRPSAVAFGCNSCSFIRGVGWDLQQAAAIGRVCHAPGTTISTAIVAALRVFGVRRISIGAPYPASVTEKMVAFMEASDFAVSAWKTLEMTTEWQIGNSPPSVWYQLAKEMDRPESEAIVLGCGGIRTAEILTLLEADLGKPVVSAPAALIWHALRLMGVDATRADRGHLFTEFGHASASHEAMVAKSVKSA